ncbi:hypothetical protein IJD44_07765 [bacterium]|nr:hypothetical protein [bacterium]
MNKQLKVKLLNVLKADLRRSIEVDPKEVIDEKMNDVYKLFKIIEVFDDKDFIKLVDDFLHKKHKKEKWER